MSKRSIILIEYSESAARRVARIIGDGSATALALKELERRRGEAEHVRLWIDAQTRAVVVGPRMKEFNMILSNLPPGVTDHDIEAAAGAFDEEEQPDRYRRDSLGFVDEGLNFAASGDDVKASSVPSITEVWGELFIDAAGGTNFKFHVEEGVGFERARECLKRFVAIIQQRIDTAEKCPFFEPETKGQ